MKVRKILVSVFTVMMLLTSSLLSAAAEDSEAIQNNSIITGSDFEKNAVGKWLPFGRCELSVDNPNGHLSSSSLKIVNRTEAYEGPSLNCSDLLNAGEEYNFSGWVYHNTGNTERFSMTLKTVDDYGAEEYTQIVGADVESDVWTNLMNTLQIPEDISSSLLYIECDNEKIDFSIDDFFIIGDSFATSDNEVIEYNDKIQMDFENDFNGWSSRGDMTVARTDEYRKSGTHSIYATNRTKAWHGPMVNISNKIKKEESYYYSAYVMYNGKEYSPSHKFRMEIQYTLNGVGTYNLIESKVIKKGKWTKIEGYYTVPEEAENICLYIQTENVEDKEDITIDDIMSYYVDSITIARADVIKKENTIRNTIIAICGTAAAILLFIVARTIYNHIRKKKEALELVLKDAMTGVFNRNAYEKKIKELEADNELCSRLYYGLCDLNFLKYINDNYGHKTGDAAIIRCAEMIKSVIGNSGSVYRIGGDEFVFMSKNPIEEKFVVAAENESKIDKGYPFVVACGFAQYDAEKYTAISEIITQCDKKMYAHKQKIKAENEEFSRK